MVNALLKETELRKGEMTEEVSSIYFGGGTPSVLNRSELELILDTIRSKWPVSQDAEITLEANPDDLKPEYLEELKKAGINRLSIGVQSFREDILSWMNRSHTAEQAVESITQARELGFRDITVDLIFGIPGTDRAYWEEQLEKVLRFDIPHLSLYALTVEEKTALAHSIRSGKQKPPLSDEQAEQFILASEKLTGAGYEHYEISNYARPGHRAIHNSSYWSGAAYLGIGPSAHSFSGNDKRSWNPANNQIYMRGIEENKPERETEILSRADQINEYILTHLRTLEGIDLDVLKTRYQHVIEPGQIADPLARELFTLKNNILRLTLEGRLLADQLASDLFVL